MLRDLTLKTVYDSDDCDLVQDLIVPLLSGATEYWRGVGFFSSGWLRLAAHGLGSLAGRGGKARIVISPILEEQDWRAMQLGQRAKDDEVLRQLLSRHVTELEQSLESDTLNTFAWLVADGILEMRFAIPRHDGDRGQYHDKVAIFTDARGDVVAIHGSFNDSIQGTLNGEAFSVFCSWCEAHRGFVDQHTKRLQRLWDGRSAQFHAYALPEAIKEQIVKLRVRERPYLSPSPTRDVKTAPRVAVPVELFGYQREAIQAWENAGYRGILEMATGTGKTYTALAAAVRRLESCGQLAVLILVPYVHLVTQCRDDLLAKSLVDALKRLLNASAETRPPH